MRLLADLRSLFNRHNTDRLSTIQLITELRALDESPWGELDGRPLDARRLARELARFSVRPVVFKDPANTPTKGYVNYNTDRQVGLADAWDRYLPPPATGAAVANFTIAANDRRYDAQTGQWIDGDATFLRCSIWHQAAENVTESLSKGTRVLVTGHLRQRSYETPDGHQRTVFELAVTEIGPSLKWATAKVTKPTRTNGGPDRAAAGVDEFTTQPADPQPADPPY